MTPMSLEKAREALIARQGAGAKYDAPGAPASSLLAARRESAQLARLLNDTSDAALYRDRGARTLAGIIAQIALEARAMSEVIAAARADAPLPALTPAAEDVALAATLPSRALRHLFDHTRVHLNVEWRDMTDADWRQTILTADGATVALVDLPRARADALATASRAFFAA